MQNNSGRRCVMALMATLLAALLAGCAINHDLRLATDGAGLAPQSQVSIQPAAPENPRAALFAASLADAFAQGGHSVQNAAPVIAVFGLAQASRMAGTADGSPAADGQPPAIAWISAPARKRPFQECKGERLRATLALYSRDEKTLIYRATGEMDGCKFAQADIDALAKALVEGASR